MSGRRRFGLLASALGLLAEALVLGQRGYGLGGNVVVRCRDGHLFTTIWIPGASLKSLRLGWWRLQRCPVGSHWSLVTPVDEAELSRRQQRLAHKARDIRIP
jgi:hypothetical protein